MSFVRLRSACRPLPLLVCSLAILAGADATTETMPPGMSVTVPLTSTLPLDVNQKELATLSPSEAQRLFDVFSWQSLIALMWPALPNGQPDPKATVPAADGKPLVWEHYREIGTVFLPNGADPKPWGDEASQKAAKSGNAPQHNLWMGMQARGKNRSRAHVAGENLQAFAGPLIDQQGNWVRYEVLMNATEFDYIDTNGLYSLDGQAAYVANHEIDFPANTATTPGSMELKLAWKQLSPQDDPERFFVRKCLVTHQVANAQGVLVESKPTVETMGLVGMHIAVRTQSSPTWVWATFEQVDNLDVNDMQKDSHGNPLRPLFTNPDSPTKPVNVEPTMTAATTAGGAKTTWAENLNKDPVQVLRVQPITGATQALNRQAQAALAAVGSKLRYYQLIGTQWPVQPSFPAFAGGVTTMPDGTQISSAPESIVYKTPGKVTPTYLVNMTMETYFMKGNQVAGPLEEDDRLPSGTVSDPNTVFGTESCVGCHFSAGACVGFKKDFNNNYILDSQGNRVPVFGKDASNGQTGNAHYSWLLQMRAQAKPLPPTK
jgi:hypothetical protein